MLLNACLLGCILVCASLLLVPLGLPAELLPHIAGLLLLAGVLAFSVNWLVSLTGVVSPEQQRRELFGDAQPDLTVAGSTSVQRTGPPASPPPVEQRLPTPLPPSLGAAVEGAGDVPLGTPERAKDL